MKYNKLKFSLTTKTLNLFVILLTLGFTSCDNDDDNPDPVNEEEVITTMTVTLTSSSADTVTLQSQDLDGDGPNAPVITVSDALAANITYEGSIVLLNETETPAENITTEVKEEDEEHQFIFVTSGAINDITYTDLDSDGNPVGIEFSLETGSSGVATLQITLRHEPKKPNDGTLSDAGGETDISQTFNLSVQ